MFHEPPKPLALDDALERHFLRMGWAGPADIERAKSWAVEHPGKSLGDALLECRIVSEERLARAYGAALGWPFMDVAAKPPLRGAARLMSRALAEEHRVVPIFAHQHRIVLGTDRPVTEESARRLQAHFARELDWAIAPRSSLDKAIRAAFS